MTPSLRPVPTPVTCKLYCLDLRLVRTPGNCPPLLRTIGLPSQEYASSACAIGPHPGNMPPRLTRLVHTPARVPWASRAASGSPPGRPPRAPRWRIYWTSSAPSGWRRRRIIQRARTPTATTSAWT
eukprot:916071-Pyramimonas_sp.AAC.1